MKIQKLNSKTIRLVGLSFLSVFMLSTYSTYGHKGIIHDNPFEEEPNAITEIINGYLALKNKLVHDNSKKAAVKAKILLKSIKRFKSPPLDKKESKTLAEIMESTSEQVEHISKNADDIDHQREHLEVLSTDLKDLIDLVGSDRVLYRQYCPMALDGKGAYWLSDSEKIRNPYFGNSMLKCGSVKQKIDVKR